VPANVPGELYVGGRGVAKGYWNRPDLTQASFHHEELKWLHETSELVDTKGPIRWYKTGDLVKWLPCGELLFLGRTDSQVKLRGMRIELQEVRNVLLQSSQVKDAEVLVVGERLVAYVILVPSAVEASGMVVALREYAGRRLPVHMVPHELLVVDEWPRTPNGKLDLRALAQLRPPKKETASNQQDGNGGDNGLESDGTDGGNATVVVDILKQAWREVLDVDDECSLTKASFFELGGNSLSAIRVISLVKPHGISLKLESFFRCKSLLEMAAACASTLAIDGCPQHKNMVIPLNWKPWSDGDSITPLFLIHCADGTVWKMMELARRLPFPVFGLQATHGGSAESVEALARIYWEEIQAVQRSGPYRIGGFSFGCRIAHAIVLLARERDGAIFEPLTLLDGVPFHYANRRKQSTDSRPEEDDKDDAETNVTEYVARALGYKPSPQQPQDGAGRADHTRDPERELFDQLVANYASHCELDHLYRPCASGNKCDESMVHAKLFKTSHWHIDAAAYRARGVDLEIVPVEGEHLTMLRMPHVESVAGAMLAGHES
jgi:thioesterase domain-containing protein